MAPTESSILSNFLLLPAPLHTFITLQKFTELFPRPQRSNPQIKLLYRELQYLRGLQTDEIKENIAQEVKIGSRQQKEVARARRKTERYEIEGFDGREIDMEIELCGPISNLPRSNPHTLTSILPEMAQACTDVEAEIAAMEAEAEAILNQIKSTVGDLSDLRYGRLQRPGGTSKTAVDEAMEGTDSSTNPASGNELYESITLRREPSRQG